jgi:O-antigen/teichoic acid export membrane protein
MKVYQGCTQVVFQAGIPVVHPGSIGLLIGSALGYCGGVGTLARAAWKGEGEQFKRVTLAGIREVAIRYRRFPMIGSISAMLNFTGVFLPPILISSLFDPVFAGQFALSQRVTAIPLALIGQAVGQVYIGEASTVIRTGPEGLEGLVRVTIRRLVQLGFIPVLAIAALGPLGFGWIFGTAWKQAGWIGLWLAPMYLLQFVAVPLSQTMNMLELQDRQLAWDLSRLIAVAAALVVPGRLGVGGMGTLAIYGGVMTIFYGILLISILRVSRGTRGIGSHV